MGWGVSSFDRGILPDHQLPKFFLIGVFSALLIEKNVFLIPKINAPDAMFAPDAIARERYFRAVLQVLRKTTLITAFTTDDFVTQLTLLEIQTIGAIHASLIPHAVQAIAAVVAAENHVAILIALRLVRVFAVLALLIVHRDLRHNFKKLGPLLEERL